MDREQVNNKIKKEKDTFNSTVTFLALEDIEIQVKNYKCGLIDPNEILDFIESIVVGAKKQLIK